MKFLLALILVLWQLSATAQVTFNDSLKLPKQAIGKTKPVVEKTKNGQVNWTDQYIEAKGTGIIDTTRWKNKAQARAMAERAALVVAQRNLLEIVKGVDINSQTTVKDLMVDNDNITSSVQGTVKGAQPQGEPVEKNGAIIITLRMPLYADNGLADVVYKSVPDATNANNAQGGNAGNGGNANANRMAPPDNQNTQANTNNNSNNNGSNASGMGNQLKQIALNFVNGKPINPQLFPVIFDSNGNVVLDTKSIYDPNKGQFPQIAQVSKEVLQAMGAKNAVSVIDVIQNSDGKIVLANTAKGKFWEKAGKIAGTLGKVLLAAL